MAPARLTPVLHLLNGEQYAGLERVVDHLVDLAPAHGFNPVLGLLKPDAMPARMASSATLVRALTMRSRFDLGIAERAAQLSKESGYRLVHSHTVRSALVAHRVSRRTGLPWVHQIHSPALHESERRGMNLVNFLAEAAILRRADAVIAVSASLADYASRCYRIDPTRLVVVPNGVRSRSDGAAGVGGSESTADRTPLSLVTVGLFRPRKGVETLVDATARLLRDGHYVHLNLIGAFADEAYERAIRTRVDRLGLVQRVKFHGFVADPSAQMTQSDIFCCPSRFGEGMPMAVLEAMSVAMPIVASDIDGIRETLADGAGMLVRPGSPELLADAITRLAADPSARRALGHAARARQRGLHSIKSMCVGVFTVYRRLLAKAA